MHVNETTRAPWTILVLLCAAQFMVILDVTVVNVALPSIGADLGFARADLQWVVTTYVLLAGGLYLLGGRAADRFDRRRVFLAGLLTFTAASLAAALAPGPAELIAARAAQGIGAALLTPAALAIVVTTYAGAQQTKALAVWGVVGSGGAAAGMVLGGALTSAFGWQAIFLVNVPVGLAAALLAPRVLPAFAPRPGRLDLPGAATAVAGLVALVYGLQQTQPLALLAGAALLAAFAAVERNVARPLVPPATWRSPSLVAGMLLTLAATGILVATFFLNSLYLQDVLHASALEAGLAFLPIALAIGAAAHVASHLLSHVGSRVLATAGLTLMAAGTALLSLAHGAYFSDLLPGFVILGLGAGLVFPTASVIALHDVDHARAGVASGLMMTAHEVGAALGVAAIAGAAYGDGFLAAALIAGALALASLAALPVIRPAAGVRAGLH